MKSLENVDSEIVRRIEDRRKTIQESAASSEKLGKEIEEIKTGKEFRKSQEERQEREKNLEQIKNQIYLMLHI